MMVRFAEAVRNSRRCWWTAVLGLLLALQPGTLDAAEAVLIGAGDIAKCGKHLPDAEATAKLLDQFFADLDSSGSPVEAVVFTTGDNSYPKGTAKEFAECYGPTWGRHKDRTRPAVGNHEYKTRGAKPYYAYFGKAAGDPDKGYYSYELGDWHVIALNSACGKVPGGCKAGSPQYQWLVNDLKANSKKCTVAYLHHPLFSSGKHGEQGKVQPFFQALYDHGADLVLAGHDHHYERFGPQDPEGRADSERGIRQFIVGSGGRERRSIGRPEPNSEARARVYGVLKVTLKPDSYDWEFLSTPAYSSFQDSGSGTCH